jgi:hypothetical protein
MAKVFLTTLYPQDASVWELAPFRAFVRSAKASSHELVADPKDADIIFFTDEGRRPLTDSFSNPFYRNFWNKCFIFAQNDFPTAVVPGLYASLSKEEYDPAWCWGGFYARDSASERDQVVFTWHDPLPFPESPQYLCSFAGSCQNASVRQKLKELQDPRCLIVDVNRDPIKACMLGDQAWIKRLKDQYLEVVGKSKFSLCPRGSGTNSYRLYESMAMGRAPVILSDKWVASPNIPWEEFSIRIPERDYKSIVQILSRQEDRAEELGKRARQAWEKYFHPDKVFEQAVEAFLEIRASGKTTKWYEHRLRMARLLPKIGRSALQAGKARLLELSKKADRPA